MASPLADVTAVLRADADSTIGYGHVVRISALAVELADLGAQAVLVTRMADPPGDAIRIPPDVPAEAEGRWFASTHGEPEVALLDLFVPDAEQIAGWRAASRFVGFIDDAHPDFEFDVDLLVSPAIGTQHEPSPNAEYLAGPGCVLLRRGFSGVDRPPPRRELARVLICLGGSDPRHLTLRIVPWVLEATDATLDVVVGAGFEHKAEMARFAEREDRVRLHVAVADVARRMAAADVGVLGAGTLAYEAAALGLPAVLVSVSEAQAWEASALDRAGAAKHLTWQQLDAETISGALGALAPQAARAEMSQAGQSLMDGAGARRVAEHIALMWATHGRQQ